MASSDNLTAMEQPWGFRPTFTDAWVPDVYNRETDAFTRALQMSDGRGAEMVESFLVAPDAAPVHTPTASGCSENEVVATRGVGASGPRRGPPPAGGRVAKRRSRASKRRSVTTFIAADAVNFRQMVQQVTGVRFPGAVGVMTPAAATEAQLLRPEPHRMVDWHRIQMGSFLPAFSASGILADGYPSNLVAPPLPAAGHEGGGLEFDPFCSFPTLESWKVM
ncbi:VQ motif-containing protein [Striga hermonthica]|uniref:VQ motif-containing protein n=1 Tax=Striga hermonthica TaxID=68872 RepID=A0A9N7NKP1_STRHE|nr:VQ motif-containing protein [Striga hermonthica]